MFLAFSTANEMELPQVDGAWRQMTYLNDERLDPVYLAEVEAVEEAVLNAMLMAKSVPTARTAAAVCRAFDGERLLELMGCCRYRRGWVPWLTVGRESVWGRGGQDG